MCKFDVSESDLAGDAVLECLRVALATPNLDAAVRCYFEDGATFAGRTFDFLGVNRPNEITSDDLLAVSLLDVRWKPSAVRALLYDQATQVSSQLRDIDAHSTLWDGERGCHALVAAERLWQIIDDLDGVGATRTSKLLARKRPLLVPITDSIIVSAMGGANDWWRMLRYCFMRESFREAVESLQPPTAHDVSLLRIFDVAIWMLRSKSRDARKVREIVGVPEIPAASSA